MQKQVRVIQATWNMHRIGMQGIKRKFSISMFTKLAKTSGQEKSISFLFQFLLLVL